jgi:hypothetical protein
LFRGNEDDYVDASARGLFEEEDSDCEEEEFNEEHGGQSPVDRLGRTLDACPTQRRSGPHVSRLVHCTVQCLACVQKHNHVLR